ncbi:hypothetical protein L1785_04485 [Antribacter sp. KLBMP9083]|uniref:Heavy metal transporter n=1 Tax=Antribacter soli TaxID=2910976 RepID=A0AA41QCR9_9MICO|nr:hypothetical protein [Antribacter soli]MCF4120231.1 hypothetical protein [Antribacter soli]
MVLLAENEAASPFPPPSARPPRRRRRLRRAVVAVVTTVVLGGAAAYGVSLGLRQLDEAGPATERCSAVLDGITWYLSPAQADNAALITGIAQQRALPARAATIGLATAMQESKLVNIEHGDRDSLGLFQQRPSQGWGTPEQVLDPVFSTNAFYDGLVKVDGYEAMEITVAAQAVQRSAYPDAYAKHEIRSRAWASALTGNTPEVLTCELAGVPEEEALPVDQARSVLVGRLGRDLGLAPVTAAAGEAATASGDGTVVTVDAAPLTADDPARGAWATAQWAVATAATTHVVEVRVADRVWTRDEAAWAAADDALPAGTVTITLTTASEG